MYIRLNGKLVDLRTVTSVIYVNNEYKIVYDNKKVETIATEHTEPKNSIDLMNALVTVFDSIEEWDGQPNK